VSELDAGLYTQMRLIIGSVSDGEPNILGEDHPFANYVILRNPPNEIHQLFVPSGMQTGIKLVREFTINENEATELILDFDAARSVVKAGTAAAGFSSPRSRCSHDTSSSIIRGTVVAVGGALWKGFGQRPGIRSRRYRCR